MVKFAIFGCVHDAESFFCEELGKKIEAVDDTSKSEFTCMFEVEFLVKLEELKKQFPKSPLNYYTKLHIVLRDDQLIGDMEAFAKVANDDYQIENAEAFNNIVYNRSVRELTYNMMTERGHPIVFMELLDKSTDTKEPLTLGTIYIELFDDLCPKGVDNFIKLCEGAKQPGAGRKATTLHYEGCPVHRIVKDGWFQCGDLVDGSGSHSSAVLNLSGAVPDESYSVDFGFSLGGIVGYANSGAHTNGSQFFVTLGPCDWMNTSFVGIGRIIQGYPILRKLNAIKTSNQCPQRKVVVDRCGVAPEA